MAFELYYWPGLQGRGEFVRLALEEAGAEYVDVARRHDGMAAMNELLGDDGAARPPFAPPFLKDGDVLVGQTAAILLYLGGKLRLAPRDEPGRLWTHQIQLTIADLVAEAHDCHHPIASSLYYEDQKTEAKRRSADFRDSRIPKYLAWFQTLLRRNPHGTEHLVGDAITYADLSLFQVIEGLSYAFPKTMVRLLLEVPAVANLHTEVASRPRIAAYLASDRRQAFNEQGIFRYYPELDDAPDH